VNGLNFFLRAWILGSLVFIPAFIIALVMIRAPMRAFLVSLVFTVGGALAFAAAVTLGLQRDGNGTLTNLPETLLGNSLTLLYCCAAAVGGGVLALWAFNKIVKSPPGQRF